MVSSEICEVCQVCFKCVSGLWKLCQVCQVCVKCGSSLSSDGQGRVKCLSSVVKCGSNVC